MSSILIKKNHCPPSKLKNGNLLITDKKAISEEFNNFFSTIGQNINSKIPKSKRTFGSFLDTEIGSNFTLRPVTENEVITIIAGLDESKAGSSSISTHFLKKFHLIFTPIITRLINKSFLMEFFPIR